MDNLLSFALLIRCSFYALGRATDAVAISLVTVGVFCGRAAETRPWHGAVIEATNFHLRQTRLAVTLQFMASKVGRVINGICDFVSVCVCVCVCVYVRGP